MGILVAGSTIDSLLDVVFVTVVVFVLARNYFVIHFIENSILVWRVAEIFQVVEIFGKPQVVKKIPAISVFWVVHFSHFLICHLVYLIVVGDCVYFYLVIEVGSRFYSVHARYSCFFQHQVGKESCVIDFLGCSCSFRVILHQ